MEVEDTSTEYAPTGNAPAGDAPTGDATNGDAHLATTQDPPDPPVPADHRPEPPVHIPAQAEQGLSPHMGKSSNIIQSIPSFYRK